uniref:Dienelactone hydrolase-like enzyme n=1 Tax=Desulfovibrio sp. U5L TaxID=596152 RepID=I2Q6B4_9BACT
MRKAILLFSLFFLCLAATPRPAQAAPGDIPSANLPIPGHPATVERFAAPGRAMRPAVILLPGRQGIDPLRAFYRRYAEALARLGLDAYLLSYYEGADRERMVASDAAGRQELFAKRLQAWSRLVRDVVGLALAQKECSGSVGLLGFSQGGFLATAVAGQDSRIGALVVFYGGIPKASQGAIARLPPLLALHGDADAVVPLASGQALVDLARGLGGPAELAVFAQAGHGFAGKDADAAESLALAFLRRHLAGDRP